MASCNFQERLELTNETKCNLKQDKGKCDKEKCILFVILEMILKRT